MRVNAASEGTMLISSRTSDWVEQSKCVAQSDIQFTESQVKANLVRSLIGLHINASGNVYLIAANSESSSAELELRYTGEKTIRCVGWSALSLSGYLARRDWSIVDAPKAMPVVPAVPELTALEKSFIPREFTSEISSEARSFKSSI